MQAMDTLRRVLVAVPLTLALIGGAVSTAAGESDAAALGTKRFIMPSGNIACLFDSGLLRCDIFSGLKPEPSRDCDFLWSGVQLRADGRAKFLCIIDTIYDRDAPVLAYGTKWKRDGIVCKSSTNGLRCHNPNRHGFFLSRELSRKW